MARMREAKNMLRKYLGHADWRSHLEEIASLGATGVGPLFSFLLLDPLTMHRAAVALGRTCDFLASEEPEKARNVIRRYMWHLSEESGNIGWGIPEAFAESLVASPLLKRDFYRILITYVIDLGHEDNYCDNPLLRRSCYWACARFCEENVSLCLNWRPHLLKGLQDEDIICRGMACYALSKLPLDLMALPSIRHLAEEEHHDICVLFDGENLIEKEVSTIAQETLSSK